MANYSKIYLIGIGGIGMSAIARYFNAKGYSVSGYDRTPSELTHELEAEGIEVHYEDNTAFVPKDPENTMVIYTPAIPHDMGELAYVNENGYKTVKRSRVLGEITDGKRCLAIAGTHGKTTTSTLLAHILTFSRRRMLCLSGRHIEKLRHEPAYRRQRHNSRRSGRIRQVVSPAPS